MSTDAYTLRVLGEVADELARARQLFPDMHSPHEGYATILEELDELWEHVKGNTGRGNDARTEAIQIAAMALRYVCDCTDPVPASQPATRLAVAS